MEEREIFIDFLFGFVCILFLAYARIWILCTRSKQCRLVMSNSNLRMALLSILGLMVIFTMPPSHAFTDPRDVFAINFLYVDLGAPPLPGWRIDGDPCLEVWQGVECVDSNVTAIILNGANLGGQLNEKLGYFASIITIDLSNNHIGGTIPENLPITMRNFFLSGNQFTGTIPNSLSNLTLLTAMAVNNNLLGGELPDAFQSLTGLINLDLSSNKLNGQLPPSMGNLSSLTTLHVQHNHFSGTLVVLQDLPLADLNIENNLFSGPIPGKLLTIPNFKKDGNPFNTTIPPSSESPPSSVSVAPVPPFNSPSNNPLPEKIEHKTSKRVIIYAAIASASLIVAVLIVIVCTSKLQKRQKDEEDPEVLKEMKHEKIKGPKSNATLIMPNTVPKEKSENQEGHDMVRISVITMPPLAEKIVVDPIITSQKIQSMVPKILHPESSVSSFSVASLQQYTNSFTEENLISKDNLTKVYLAKLPDRKLLTVMKLDNVNLKVPSDEFLELALRISELHHPNVLELVGYCMEFEQRLLVYKYFSKVSLNDVLHCEDDFKKQLHDVLHWNARVGVALGAARALEYLHEVCRSPVMHKNFDSTKILIDDELRVCVSECGLASLTLSNTVGQIHAAPNYEALEVNNLGLYTEKSDVYSFGVVMLELLTGRKPYESSRAREQQYLVRWASPQLYDINALSRMVDPSIDGKVPMKSLSWFADIINRCIQQQPEFRPPMSEVVQDLACMIDDARINANGTRANLL